jgi:hypothetical protein
VTWTPKIGKPVQLNLSKDVKDSQAPSSSNDYSVKSLSSGFVHSVITGTYFELPVVVQILEKEFTSTKYETLDEDDDDDEDADNLEIDFKRSRMRYDKLSLSLSLFTFTLISLYLN